MPLIRNPDTKQMFCVICENIILTEEEALALERKKTLEQAAAPAATAPEPAQTKPVHSPIVPQVTEERKRQKTEAPAVSQINSSSSNSDFYSSQSVVSTLSSKMNELTERVKACHDASELTQLFKAIKQCAGAIEACLAAGQAYDKSVSI